MKVLMVAPKICTPWTEGRKKFFRDLCQETVERWDVVAFVTVDEGEDTELPVVTEEYISKNGWQHLANIRSNLAGAIRRHQPDLVCHLPFGVFSGLRGLANIWMISYVERLCRRLEIPCCTLMYSLTGEANKRFHRRTLRNVYFNQHALADRTVRFGVKLPEFDQSHSNDEPNSEKNILFMAGAADETEERLNYVLDVRGLRFLLKAGEKLQMEGYRLIVAIPLLKNKNLRERVIAHKDNHWNSGAIEYCEKLTFPDIYRRTHVFAFPYASEELQFVPTSIIEAMHFAVPVILPKLNFLEHFYRSDGRTLAYEKDSVESFIEQLKLIDNHNYLNDLITNAKSYIHREYDIGNSVTDVEEIYQTHPDRSQS